MEEVSQMKLSCQMGLHLKSVMRDALLCRHMNAKTKTLSVWAGVRSILDPRGGSLNWAC